MAMEAIPLPIDPCPKETWKDITTKKHADHPTYSLKFALYYHLDVIITTEPSETNKSYEGWWNLYKQNSCLASNLISADTKSQLFKKAIEEACEWFDKYAQMWHDLNAALMYHKNTTP